VHAVRDGLLIQEEYAGEDRTFMPWRVVVSTVMCQQTSGSQVRPVLDELFSRWPEPAELALADRAEVESVISPCGLQSRRADTLNIVSNKFHEWECVVSFGIRPPHEWVGELPGCGEYTVEAYRFVAWGDRSFKPKDKELLKAWERDGGV